MIGALLSSAWGWTGALAQSATIPANPAPGADALAQAGPTVKVTPGVADAIPYWWFHGTVEVGGRGFLNNPTAGGQAGMGQDSLAKYYTYSTVKPGPFSDFAIATGSKDGLYQIDLGGKNVGYSDQSYYLDMSKAGEHYLSLGWDQTPHVYSMSAQTPWVGVGTNWLSLPGSTATTLNNFVKFLQPYNIGIERDTASVDYRWTPSDAWDIKADWSNMRRTGTQVDGVIGLSGASPFQVIKPVDDNTQNYGLSGEYAGTSPWGQKFTFKLGYRGSQYTDDYSSYMIQGLAGTAPGWANLSLPPSNQANSFNSTLAAELPWKSRYAGTLNYTKMTQNTAFINESTQGPGTGFSVLPAASLNGDIDTLLSNNVVTTKITPDLTSKLTYRYYDYKNNTPQLLFPSWVSEDKAVTGVAPEGAIRNLVMSYTKQDAGADFNWRPSQEWNLGAAYNFERYDYTQADADITNENSGKVYVDWKPESWLTVRSSGYIADRRYVNYDYYNFVANIQFPGFGGVAPTTTKAGATNYGWVYNMNERQLMYDNRVRTKANFAVDLVALHGLTITPTFQYKDDNYGVNPLNQQGLQDSKSWSTGVDVTYVINPDTSVMAGYLYERYYQVLYALSVTGNPAGNSQVVTGPNLALTNDTSTVNTFTAAIRYSPIPAVQTELRYSASRGVDSMQLQLGSGASPTGGQFPDMTTWFSRLDATVTYKLDQDLVQKLGWKGEVTAKLHYAWEQNSVANWAQDPFGILGVPGSGSTLWLAYDNPNYNVQMLSGSLAFKW
jgi:MtrB/PioB family decaheme-associated outer membrane protein